MANQFIIRREADIDSFPYDAVVGMSVYANDRLDWLDQSVDSILLQTYTDFLFVIVLDGEVPAAMLELLLDKHAQDSRIMLIQSVQNIGLSACMNHIIEYSLRKFTHAEFFFRMDADDMSLPERIEQQIRFLRANADISMVGTSLVEVNEHGKKVGKRLLPETNAQIRSVLPRRCAINHPTVAIRMAVFTRGHRYRSDLRNTQDYFLWVDFCADNLKMANMPIILLQFRRVNDFYKRRGLAKSVNEFKARFYAMKRLNAYSVKNILYASAVIVLRMMPSKLIKLAYKVDRFLLHR